MVRQQNPLSFGVSLENIIRMWVVKLSMQWEKHMTKTIADMCWQVNYIEYWYGSKSKYLAKPFVG